VRQVVAAKFALFREPVFATRRALVTHLWPSVTCVLRLLRRAPGFTVVSIVTLGIGIGFRTSSAHPALVI
jgi:hypothetical protein